MGLFDKIPAATPLSKQEGFAAIILAAVYADGHMSDEEKDSFVRMVSTSGHMRLFADQTDTAFSNMLDRVFEIKGESGVDGLILQGAKALPQDLRETAFAVASDMIFVDGSVGSAEKEVIQKMQSALEIPDQLASQIIDVMVIKYRA